ncbi:UvrD-helicase domain-containing protein [Salsipaludibacter albus]|uniref:UvrD-helicase domain-containing protein n=1 Tax=Salsipaludibacter albus TaxID=2849650 RepID=UPI001EE3A63A|nr:UvrD-helicase domain-containing protein [Salsipaludibacter albus]MBY5161824.1 UvrD-helicase domain-containing protein [Salsipaludibacter albus]
MTRPEFDLTGPLPTGRVSLEASAGTGKTWTIAALVLRYVAEGVASLDELLVVTFTRAATAELRDRIRGRLAVAGRHLRAVQRGTTAPDDTDGDAVLAALAGADGRVGPDELRRRAERVETALSEIDAALISTIHGFAHQVLRSVGFAGDVDGSARLVEDADDLMVDAAADLLVRLYSAESSDEVLAAAPSGDQVHKIMVERLRHPHATVSPGPDQAAADDAAVQAARVAGLIGGEIQAAKDRRGIMTFDDLMVRLVDSLADPRAGPEVVATFHQRFRVALVDEAQDTDPVQWQILETLFADRTLVLIGDPKQAIYRFRGADVGAYVRATSTPATTHFSLATNWRSDRSLVDAVNTLFRETTFGDDRIAHRPVRSHHGDRLAAEGAALQLRLHPVPDSGDVRAEPGRRAIAADLAAHVTRLLADAPTVAGRREPLGPADIAVLVRSHSSVEHVTEALEAAGIPHVVNGVGSVFEAPAADDWLALLQGLDLPSSTVRARAVAGSAFVGMSTERRAALDERDLDRLAGDLHRWATVLRRDGVASLVRTLHADTDLGARLLAEVGGARMLTDIEHVGELLHRSGSAGDGPTAAVQWLTEQRTRVVGDEVPAEQRARRLETDSAAVQIMTIHGAKGLEFPVVYLPYLNFAAKRPSVPFTTTGDEPVLELGGPRLDEHRDDEADEDNAENLRLAYVAFTRARHRCIAWWWRGSGYTRAPLSKLLLRRPGTSVTGSSTSAMAKGVEEAADDLVALTDGTVSWTWMSDEPEPVPVTGSDDEVPPLAARDFDRPIDRTWTRTSFTGLATPRRAGLAGAEVEVGDDATAPRTDEADHAVVAEVDEDARTAGDGGDGGEGPGTVARALPLGQMTGGARVGTLVHDLYEHVDFTASDVGDQVRARLGALVGPGHDATRSVLGMSPDDLVDGVLATLRTPLGDAFGGLRLADLPPRDRIDELAFELPLGLGVAGDGPRAVDLGAIRDAFAGLPAGDPMADHAARLDDPALHRVVRGYLTGFVDLVARRVEDDRDVFHVVDYKTNVLYGRDEDPSSDHYDRGSLVTAMHHGHYPLQAALYAVAVHRFLRWRLSDYDPGRNLGAIGYLFVRGMVGPDTPVDPDGHVAGVFAWTPPPSFVVDLSERLHHGREVVA